ncbi:hypothetical protein ACSW8S_18065 (plasmid) [Clostridium perfringens]
MMINLLGRKIMEASDYYIKSKSKFESYDDFFCNYISDKIVLNDESEEIINSFIEKLMSEVSEDTPDSDIRKQLDSLRFSLMEKRCMKKHFDVAELVGFILLGNIKHDDN